MMFALSQQFQRKIMAGFMMFCLLPAEVVLAKPVRRPAGVKTILLGDMEIGTINVHPDGTVVNFPGKPDIHVGKKGAFEIAFVENDLIISGKAPGSKTNIFIYLGGRRFTLKLVFNGASGDQIISVRDPRDSLVEEPNTHE